VRRLLLAAALLVSCGAAAQLGGGLPFPGPGVMSYAGGGGSALEIDAVGSGITDQSGSGPFTYSHTVGSGSNRLIVCGVGLRGDGGIRSIDSVTYNGVALTAVSGTDSYPGFGDRRVQLWQLVAPATGSNTVSFSVSGATQAFWANCISFTGAHQTTPVTGGTQNTNSGTTASVTVSSGAGHIVMAVGQFASNNAGQVSVSSGTERWELYNGSQNAVFGGATNTGASPNATVSWTINSVFHHVAGASVNPS
jgi:hypothetical protein